MRETRNRRLGVGKRGRANMTEASGKRASTRGSRSVRANRKAVYHAFLDPDSVASWLSPDNMRGRVYAFDAREGGTFRVSLTYQDLAHSLSLTLLSGSSPRWNAWSLAAVNQRDTHP